MPRKQINRQTDFKTIDPSLLNALLQPCRTIEHYDLFLRKFLDVELASETVSRFSTTNPLELAWEIYRHATSPKGVYLDTLDVLATASRGSQKTLLLAVVECTVLLHDRRSVLHYAASKSQAASGFAYVSGFFNNSYLRMFQATRPTKERISLRIPNVNNLDDVKLLTCDVLSISQFNVESRHESFIGIDELSSLSNDKLNSYRYISGIPVSTSDGRPPIILQISSRKATGSLIEELIAKAPETGLVVKSWTCEEMTSACPPSKHGTEKMRYYGSPYEHKVVTPEVYETLEDKRKIKYFEADGFKNCYTSCEIAHSCLSQLANQKCNIRTLNSVQKTISDYKKEPQLWTAQRLSLEGTREGSIYSAFSIDRHLKTEAELLKLLAAPETYTELLPYLKKQKFLKAVGIDHSGGSAEGAIILSIIDEKGRIFVIDYFVKEGLDTETMIVKLKEWDDKYKIDVIFPDPAAVDKNTEIERAGFLVQSDLRKSVISGIDSIRSYLMNFQGITNMYFLRGKTDLLASDMMKYRFKSKIENIFTDEPVEEGSHGPDALRYLTQNIIERNYKGVSITLTEEEPKTINNLNDIRRAMNNSFKKHLQNLGVEGQEVDEVVQTFGSVKVIL